MSGIEKIEWTPELRADWRQDFSHGDAECDWSEEAHLSLLIALEAAEAEVARLTRDHESALAEVAHLRSTFFAECPKNHEHGVWCGSDWVSLKHRAEAAEAEVERLTREREVVEALAEEWTKGRIRNSDRALGEIRAALASASIEEQRQYDAAHATTGNRHCLTDPCQWHPFETRIRPAPTYPADLASEPLQGPEVL